MEEKVIELLGTNDDSITIGEHTLFIDKVEEDVEPMTINVHGKDLPVMIEGETHNKYTLYLGDFGGEKLHKIVHKLREATEDDEIEIRISSNGGSIDDVLILMNTIKERFVSITTIIEANAYSAGAMIFLIGDVRVAYHNISYMLHNYSTGFGGKGSEIKSYIDYTDEHITELFNELFVKSNYITNEEFEALKIGKDFWLNSEGLATRGIATHIILNNAVMDRDAYISWREYKGNKTFNEWVEWKIKQMEKDNG